MSSFRLSKKSVHRDNRLTMFAVHENKMKSFEEKENNLHFLEKEVEELEVKLKDPNINNNSSLKVPLMDRVKSLKQEIYSIKNNTELVDYLIKASPFFEDTLMDESNVVFNSKINRGKRCDEFLNICFNNYSIFYSDNLKNNSVCDNCGESELEIDSKNNFIVCQKCGSTTYNFGTEVEWALYESHEPVQTFNYKRKNHFKEWLIQLQAKENTNIPEDLINKIYLEMKKERLTDIEKLSYTRIKNYMSKHNYNKYFEHIPFIYKKITNKRPIELDDILENKLYEMFDAIQEPFERHKHILKNRTKNFLSYSFTIYKFCQLLGRTDLLKFFNLLKDREKIFEQEVVWKRICNDLNWEYIKG